MLIRVLGSGAGGGFPQWNCNCDNCRRLRRGEINARPRTQSSIAVSEDGDNWVLFNASPDIRFQLEANPPLQPKRGVRDTGIRAIVLIDAQIDHTTGLLILRESTSPLEIYCADPVHRDLTSGFPVLTMLGHYCGVHRHPLPIDGSAFQIPGFDDLRFYSHALVSKAPPYSPHRNDPHPGDNVGVIVEQISSGRKLYYAPGLGEIEPHVFEAMQAADCVLVDGTFWTDDEMKKVGSAKKAREIGHLPQSGPGGMIEVLNRLPRETRRILIHINNTNPILDEDSPERRQLTEAGIEVAYDTMEIRV
ncbi:pyrroloquinoline quinone biosynthesis protein B [Methylomarinovum caldicuralii]|uniref:Coenzyme PQQ synthesis protein B n=1 Tax=Methylomarinovum caldicuralii TaxID=438856 RepID=A0AAU9CIR1_9GAMM|nr:pyrroloquinoline quinone biosynthesis protein PqqB [Methylomarinovum caldicuralii]BCX82910.1 pyrroloquinoline quinone biosynthesis protein B [Methylomarinovum caldicuralii]